MSLEFKDYLSCAYLGFGLSTVLIFAFQFLGIGTEVALYYFVLLMVPYLVGGFVSGFLIGKKISGSLLLSGFKCSLAASIFNIVLYLIIQGNIQGIIWLVLGYFTGTYSGIFLRKLFLNTKKVG